MGGQDKLQKSWHVHRASNMMMLACKLMLQSMSARLAPVTADAVHRLSSPLCPNMSEHTCNQALRVQISLLLFASDKFNAVYALLIMQPELVPAAT